MNFKLLIPAVLVLISANFFNVQQVSAQELDPNILWVADSSIGIINGFAVHPNGNIFAYRNGTYAYGKITRGLKVFEIDGNTGKLIRILPKFTENIYLESIDISDNGKYLSTGSYISISFDGVRITELTTGISKTVGFGISVNFIPNTNRIIYLAANGSMNSDSSIVILDWENENRTYIRTEECIQQIAFSPDGRYFANGGFFMNNIISSYTSLKLWDAKTNKLIKELYRKEKDGASTFKIQFSPDSKSVAFLGNYDYNLKIFDTESLYQIKKYSDNNHINSFTFITPEYFGIQSRKTSILRLSDDLRTDIHEFPTYGHWIETNAAKNILYSGTGYPDNGAIIIAFDLNKIFSSVDNKSEYTTIQASYQKGTLTISGIQSVSNNVNIEIFDINGKLVRQLDLQPNGSEIRVPLKVINGTYLIHILDGSQTHSGKFLVVE